MVNFPAGYMRLPASCLISVRYTWMDGHLVFVMWHDKNTAADHLAPGD